MLKRFVSLAILCVGAAAPALASSIHGAIRQPAGGATKVITFDVTSTAGGHGSGQVSASGLQAPITNDSEESSVDVPLREFSVTIDVSCFNISGNRVAVSGSVRTSSAPEYVGRIGLLVVQDDGPDRGKWAFSLYKHVAATVAPTDNDRENDPGAAYSWTATDAERSDDAGVPNSRAQEIDCRWFPLSAHTLADLPRANGSLSVQR